MTKNYSLFPPLRPFERVIEQNDLAEFRDMIAKTQITPNDVKAYDQRALRLAISKNHSELLRAMTENRLVSIEALADVALEEKNASMLDLILLPLNDFKLATYLDEHIEKAFAQKDERISSFFLQYTTLYPGELAAEAANARNFHVLRYLFEHNPPPSFSYNIFHAIYTQPNPLLPDSEAYISPDSQESQEIKILFRIWKRHILSESESPSMFRKISSSLWGNPPQAIKLPLQPILVDVFRAGDSDMLEFLIQEFKLTHKQDFENAVRDVHRFFLDRITNLAVMNQLLNVISLNDWEKKTIYSELLLTRNLDLVIYWEEYFNLTYNDFTQLLKRTIMIDILNTSNEIMFRYLAPFFNSPDSITFIIRHFNVTCRTHSLSLAFIAAVLQVIPQHLLFELSDGFVNALYNTKMSKEEVALLWDVLPLANQQRNLQIVDLMLVDIEKIHFLTFHDNTFFLKQRLHDFLSRLRLPMNEWGEFLSLDLPETKTKARIVRQILETNDYVTPQEARRLFEQNWLLLELYLSTFPSYLAFFPWGETPIATGGFPSKFAFVGGNLYRFSQSAISTIGRDTEQVVLDVSEFGRDITLWDVCAFGRDYAVLLLLNSRLSSYEIVLVPLSEDNQPPLDYNDLRRFDTVKLEQFSYRRCFLPQQATTLTYFPFVSDSILKLACFGNDLFAYRGEIKNPLTILRAYYRNNAEFLTAYSVEKITAPQDLVKESDIFSLQVLSQHDSLHRLFNPQETVVSIKIRNLGTHPDLDVASTALGEGESIVFPSNASDFGNMFVHSRPGGFSSFYVYDDALDKTVFKDYRQHVRDEYLASVVNKRNVFVSIHEMVIEGDIKRLNRDIPWLLREAYPILNQLPYEARRVYRGIYFALESIAWTPSFYNLKLMRFIKDNENKILMHPMNIRPEADERQEPFVN